MQTTWGGFAVPNMQQGGGIESLEGLTPESALVVLPDVPSAPCQVSLPAGTRQVWLWTDLDRVWYALDALPGPIPPFAQGGVLPATIFAAGAILMPGQWQALVMDVTLSHTLGLVSAAMSPTVYVSIYKESL